MVIVIKKGASRKEIEKVLAKMVTKKGFDALKHSGVIKLEDSPIEIQKKLRDEWT